MLLDLNKIHAPRERYEKVYPPGAFSADADAFRVVAPVALAFDIVKDKRHFQLIGTVTTMLELPCSRCLESFTSLVDSKFDLRYQPHTHPVGSGHDAERQIEEDDLSTAFYDDDEIDLGQLMREQFYLSLPMKPLCGDDCRGLCPICGTNLNRGTCDCKREWEDPRLAVLKTLKTDHHKGH
jgi:DUF177 domain-containing protein